MVIYKVVTKCHRSDGVEIIRNEISTPYEISLTDELEQVLKSKGYPKKGYSDRCIFV